MCRDDSREYNRMSIQDYPEVERAQNNPEDGWIWFYAMLHSYYVLAHGLIRS